jgi:signal peptidase II
MVWVLASCVGCDQVTKLVAESQLKDAGVISFWGDVFRLAYAENRGAFLGFGSAWPEPWRWLAFTLLATLVVAASLVWLISRVFSGLGSAEGEAGARSTRRFGLAEWAMILIAAGGIGNLVDRVLRDGHVIDFMNLGVGSLRTGIFNVADLQIMVGLGLLMFSPRPKPKPALAEAPQRTD